jgi:GTP-binding protein Era
VLLLTEEEVPHSVAVVVERFKQNEKNPNVTDISATIVVERQSQKKIIIGAKGAKIKEIGTQARLDIVKFLGNKVFLELFVKVEEDWRNKKRYLKEYGYE